MKRLISAGIAVLMLIAACGAFAASGNLKITGSTTVLPISQIWAEDYMSAHASASISVAGGGSGTGISNLLNGTCDIANASREAEPKEKDIAKSKNTTLFETRIARDGLSVIVNKANKIKSLSFGQLNAIYSGSAKTWKDVGGTSSQPIVVVGRDSSSGTYTFFQEAILNKGPYVTSMLSMPTNQAVAQAVAQAPNAIGYVGLAYAEDFEKVGKLRIVSVYKKAGDKPMVPTKASIMSGKYPLFRYLYMYTLGKPKGLAADFIKFSLSPKGQKAISQTGYLPL